MYSEYIECIQAFVDTNPKTWSFKSDPRYNNILEHVSHHEGEKYLFEITTRFNDIYTINKNRLIDICMINDSCGSPNKYNISNFVNCSPTNLRYILHSLLILSWMKVNNLNHVDIVEIGGGYGGLCFFMYNMSPLFNVNIKSYTIFDLPEPLILQEKYLAQLNITTVNFMTIDNIQNIQENSFLISNYAYSEITLELQKIYTERLLNPFISHGFLTWNFIDPYKFIDNKIISCEKEYPETCHNNLYIRVKPYEY